MFQTEPIMWLQGFAAPWLTSFLTAVTLLGDTPVYIVLLLTLAFGVRLRPALGVLLVVLLSGILTTGLKEGLALPRPGDLEQGASAFWALPQPEALVAARAREGIDYGFPSGHVSSATAFLVGLALFFRWMPALAVAAAWVPLMALSRMYLGRHFLADVLGGGGVGLLGVLAAFLLLRPIEHRQPSQTLVQALAPLGVVGLALLVLAPLVAPLDPENVGCLIGLVLAYGALMMIGMPSDQASIGRRCARVLTAAALYLATSWLVERLFVATGWEGMRLGNLTAAALTTALTLAGAVAAGRRARLYLAA